MLFFFSYFFFCLSASFISQFLFFGLPALFTFALTSKSSSDYNFFLRKFMHFLPVYLSPLFLPAWTFHKKKQLSGWLEGWLEPNFFFVVVNVVFCFISLVALIFLSLFLLLLICLIESHIHSYTKGSPFLHHFYQFYSNIYCPIQNISQYFPILNTSFQTFFWKRIFFLI